MALIKVLTEFLWKSVYDCIISLKEWRVYCKPLLHGRTFVYEECIDRIILFVIRVPEFQKTNSFKNEHFEKINIKTVITYIPMPNYILFGEFWIVGPNLAKRKNDKNFKK